MDKTSIAIIIIILVLIGAGFLIFSNPSSPASPAENMSVNTNQSLQTKTGTTSAQVLNNPANVREITVTGKNYSFSPNNIIVNKGNAVKITFKNIDGVHNFKIDEFNAATKVIGANKEDTATFTADKTGSFEYYCSVDGHRAMGMKGSLIVK